MMLWITGVWGVYFLPSGRAWRMLRRSPVPCTGWSPRDVLMAKTVFVPVIGVAVSLFLPREERSPRAPAGPGPVLIPLWLVLCHPDGRTVQGKVRQGKVTKDSAGRRRKGQQ